MQTHKFQVNGMHCQACVALTENELGELPEVKTVKASLNDLSVEVGGEFGSKTAEQIANDLSCVLKPHGYSLSIKAAAPEIRWQEFYLAAPIALGFLAVFFMPIRATTLPTKYKILDTSNCCNKSLLTEISKWVCVA